MAENAVPNTQELADLARARAAFLSFLNLHFQVLPDVPFVERVRNGELTSILSNLADEPSEDGEIPIGAGLMKDYIEKTRAVDSARLSQDLGVDRTRLYRGVAPGYGPPPPYEMVWSKTGQDFGVLQEVARIYAEAGLAAGPEAQNRLDYIGIELEFVREMAMREAAGWDAGDQAAARRCLKVEKEFVSEHVAGWVPEFIERAMKHVETDFYKGHMLMLRGFLAGQKQELAELEQELAPAQA